MQSAGTAVDKKAKRLPLEKCSKFLKSGWRRELKRGEPDVGDEKCRTL